MKVTPAKLNKYLFFKLPSAYWCGVRLKKVSGTSCIVSVKHMWINQNPFGSLYFAVQAMAAELSTAALVIDNINKSGKSIAMLVAASRSTFTKKATGRITFTCTDGDIIRDAIANAASTGEGNLFWAKSIGTDAKGDIVSEFEFQWTVKMRN